MINGFRNECQTIGHDFISNSTMSKRIQFHIESIRNVNETEGDREMDR